MAKLTRIVQKLFGSGAGVDQIAQFGSLFAGSPAFTTDPATAMSLSNWLTGWAGAAIGGNAPAIEDMNACMFVFAYQLGYLLQAGIAEWDTDTVYYIGSFASVAGAVYVSRTDANSGHDPTGDPTNWKLLPLNLMTALGDLVYGGTDGAGVRLAGNTDAVAKMLTQTGDGLGGSAAPVWREIKGPTVQKFASGSGTYTKPAGVLYIRVRMAGGGGGGAGTGSSGVGASGTGGNTTFGSSFLVANGGGGGTGGGGGLGGSASITGPTGISIAGAGGTGVSNLVNSAGGCGGVTAFGGAGGGAFGNSSSVAGGSAAANSGSGGGGAGGNASFGGGGGGGAGGYIDVLVTAPSATYAYAVGALGAGGTAGTSGQAGGNGGAGVIEVTEYYQ
jgi:hypothetical protein